jgi:hypothetical protein
MSGNAHKPFAAATLHIAQRILRTKAPECTPAAELARASLTRVRAEDFFLGGSWEFGNIAAPSSAP